MFGSMFSIWENGPAPMKKIKWVDFEYADIIVGNTIFVFIAHHSISGIIYPVRP